MVVWYLNRPDPVSFDDKPYRDSINVLLNINNALELTNDSLSQANLRLYQLKQKVHIKYYPQYIYVQSADASQLDSVIRTLW